MPAPLLEEERDALIDTAVAQVADPGGIDAAMPRAGFAPGDEPVDALRSSPSSGPSSGSALMNRTAAGTVRSASAR